MQVYKESKMVDKQRNPKKISIVIPCLNEEQSIPLYYKAMQEVMAQMQAQASFELLFVDDGSTDGTLPLLRKLHRADPRVRFLSFSRNFGKEAGMYAGMQAAKGDYVGIMDVDLQDPPALLPQMFAALEAGEADCVATRRVTRRGEPRLRSLFARLFYKLINRMSRTEIVDGARDYRLMCRRMVDAVLSMREYNRFSKGIFSWVGFCTQWLEYENAARVAGESKWSFGKLLRYSLDGITAFSTAPLQLASISGLLCCLLAMGFGVFVFLKALLFGDPVAGYPTIMCVLLFLGGLLLLCIGILGQYVAKTYLETKRRPLYITKTSSDAEDEAQDTAP